MIQCEVTGKNCYSYKKASMVVKLAIKNKTIRKKPSRCYHCEYCGWWHLTSQKKRGGE